ncbi:MAG: hypothetical protein QGH40_07825 [bacterium]|nr:hypothetical protein [bacterium]
MNCRFLTLILLGCLLFGLLPALPAISPDPVLGGVVYVPSAYILSGYSYTKLGDRESFKYVRVVQKGIMSMSFNKEISGNTPSSNPETSLKFKLMGNSPFAPNLAVGSSNFSRGEEYKSYFAVLSMYLSGSGTFLHLGAEQYRKGTNLEATREFMAAAEQQVLPYLFLLVERYRSKYHGGVRLRPFPGLQADFIWEDLDNQESFKDVGFSLSIISYY